MGFRKVDGFKKGEMHNSGMQQTLVATSGAGAALAVAQPLASRQLQSLTVRMAHFFRSFNGSERGGDLLFVEREPTAMRIMIGDIVKHGLHAERHRNDIVWAVQKAYEPVRMVSGVSPSDFMSKFEQVLKSLHIEDEISLTALAAFIDLENRTLSFANAGHEKIIRYNANTGQIGVVKNNAHGASIFFGCLSGIYLDEGFPLVKVHLNPDDVLLFYTDGILDQFNNGTRVAPGAIEKGLRRVMRENAHRGAEEIRDALIAFLVSKNGSHKAITDGDDASFVVLKFA